jgi:ATP synthase protein I
MRFDRYSKNIAWASTIGLTLVFATFIGLGAGLLFDRLLGTRPYLTLIFLLLGIAAGFRNIFVSLKMLQENKKDDEKR